MYFKYNIITGLSYYSEDRIMLKKIKYIKQTRCFNDKNYNTKNIKPLNNLFTKTKISWNSQTIQPEGN